MIKSVLLDLSGVLYIGNRPLESAIKALSSMQNTGIPVRYVTNTTRTPRMQILKQLAGMGFPVQEHELFTAPMAAHAYLEKNKLRPLLLIHQDLMDEFSDLTGNTPNAVLIGDAGNDFTYANMNPAFRLLIEGAPLIAMGKNRYFQESDGLSLDAGAFVSALEYAADTQAIVTGKPSAEFFHAAVTSLNCDPADVVMVGDDVEADVNGATDAGLQGILVQTGKYRAGDEARLTSTDAITLPDFPAALDWIIENMD